MVDRFDNNSSFDSQLLNIINKINNNNNKDSDNRNNTTMNRTQVTTQCKTVSPTPSTTKTITKSSQKKHRKRVCEMSKEEVQHLRESNRASARKSRERRRQRETELLAIQEQMQLELDKQLKRIKTLENQNESFKDENETIKSKLFICQCTKECAYSINEQNPVISPLPSPIFDNNNYNNILTLDSNNVTLDVPTSNLCCPEDYPNEH
eukprot:Pgem_evm1s69